MRERAYNFSVHFRVRRGAPYYNKYCLYRHATRRKQKLKLRMTRSVKLTHAVARVREQIRMTLNTPLHIITLKLQR
jgi:hypothetical protein